MRTKIFTVLFILFMWLIPLSVSADEAETWVSTDFTYQQYSKLMYGCDYSRQLYVTGKIITGFSEAGLEKLQSGNTDLVIPSKTPEGETVTGVGNEAFKGMGLTSVRFPTGMLVPYDDQVTQNVTRRGNFLIHESAFANNELTEVYLPAGVMACMANSFKDNHIKTVTFPRTIWWIETLAFANNEITRVNFPQTCDFRLEMHGMTFAGNQITSVRLPDYTEVVNKDVFAMNPGMEPMTEEIAKKRSATDWQKFMPGGEAESGIVYMYTDRQALFDAQRIHTLDRPTRNQWSPFQKLVLITAETPDADTEKWNTSDFTYDGTTVTGLSDSGKEKQKTNKKLDIPDRTPTGEFVSAIASSDNSGGGLFGEETMDDEGNAAEVEGFDIVTLPNGLRTIGDRAFAGLGLKEVIFPNQIREIGDEAFRANQLEDVILPDSVTAIGERAFADDPKLRQIIMPSNDSYTVIGEETFGCGLSGGMAGLTSVEIPDTITEIGARAFEGNHFESIEIPASVTAIGSLAFSGDGPGETTVTVIFHDGLETIGGQAFKNMNIERAALPATLQALPADTFEKAGEQPLVTKVYVPSEEQYNAKESFPDSDWQKIYLSDPEKWTAEDYEYGETVIEGAGTVRAVTGFSEQGADKLAFNTKVTLPVTDDQGDPVQAVAPGAFAIDEGTGITGLTIPEHSVQYIGDNSFSGNDISSLVINEGVETIGAGAFTGNQLIKLDLPASLASVGEEAFSSNRIKTLEFADGGTGALSIAARAFAGNELKSLQISDNLDELAGTAFADNPGMDDDPGIVYIYKMSDSGSALQYKSNGTSECQDILFGEIPPEIAPWGPRHFTFSGSTITGFSADGEAKLAVDSYISLPGRSSSGTVVTAVGNRAFADYYGDENLKYGHTDPKTKEAIKGVEFAPSITTVGVAAFQMCAIEEIVLPDTITSIGGGAFASNYGMKKITLSGSIADLPDNVFVTNVPIVPDIEELVIPEGVKTIGKATFKGQSVRKLELPSTLTSIGEEAFFNHQLEELDIPAGVKQVGKRAFELRRDGAEVFLTRLTLHEGLEEIGMQAFGQTALDSVEIPKSLEVLSDSAFVDWRNIGRSDGKPVYLRTSDPDQAKGKGDYTGITITGAGHRVVYDKMVGTDWDYSDFTYSGDGKSITGWSDQGDQKRREYAQKNEYPAMIMPDKASYSSGTYITAIADNAFRLELYNETTGTGEVTMQKFDCLSPYGIQRMVFPEKLERIGDCAFEYNNLKAVDLESAGSLKSIGTSAFHGNHLVTVTIPDTVSELGGGAFAMNNIYFLTLSKNVTKIPQGCFSMNIFMYELEIPDTVTEIGEEAFAGARLEELEIPASVTKIGKKAFHLHHLTSLHIPGNIRRIGDSAFEGTFKESTLKTLTIDEGVEYIGKYAFKEALLEEVTLPNSLQDMGVDPFYSNKGKDGSGVVRLYSKNRDHLKFNEDSYHGKENGVSRHCHEVIFTGRDDSGQPADKDKDDAAKKAAEEAARKKAAEARVKKVRTVTVNAQTVNATVVAKAVRKAGGSDKYVTRIVLGKKVRKISKNAFKKYKKVKTLEVRTAKLKKKTVKGSLKGSAVRTIKVKVAEKTKTNKKYIKKYKKIFTRKNAGKKVSVK